MSFTSGETFVPFDPLRTLKDNLCMACGRGGAVQCCGGCGFAKFCGAECQKAGWAEHSGACAGGYNGYIKLVEKNAKAVGALLMAGGADSAVIASYEEALAAAKAMGDAEGQRHLQRVLAFRHEALSRPEEAARCKAEADRIEAIIGAPQSAKQIFGRTGGEKLDALDRGGAAPRSGGVRGARSGKLAWCGWEQTIADVTLTVPLPEGVGKAQLQVAFKPKALHLALGGGIVLADCELFGAIRPDECSWTLSGEELTLVLEKARREIWDYLLPNAPEAEAPAAAEPAAEPAAADEPATAPNDASLAGAMAAFDLAPPRPG